MPTCTCPRNLLGRTLSCVALSALMAFTLTAPAEAQTGEMKPVAVVAVTDYDELLTDIDYLGQFGGQVKAGQQMNNMLLLFTQNKGLEGLDKSKPWGAVVQTDGFQFTPVVCLPVTDLDSLLELVSVFGMATSDVGDGVTEIEIPNQSVYVKQEGDWAFLAQTPEMLATTPADPGKMFVEMTGDYDVAARVMVQNVPEMYRSIAVEQLRAGAEQGLQQQDGETDEAFEARRKVTEAQVEQIAQFINELDELALGFNSDPEQGGVILDFVYGGLPDTQVAKAIQAYTNTQTKFAGCMKDGAAMQMNICVTSPPELVAEYRDQMQGQIDSMRQQIANAIDQEADLPNEEARDTVKEAANDLMDVFEATAMTGQFDMAGHMDIREGSMSAVAGGFTKDTGKIESALKKLAALVEDDPEFPGVNWNAESHAGASIHTMSIPVPADEDEARQLFGDALDIAVALGDDVAFVAGGLNCVSEIKAAMDGSGGSPVAVKPMNFSLALTPIMQMVAETQPNPAVDAMLEALATKSDGMDQVHLTGEEVDGQLRTRFTIEEGVLQAIGASVMEARRQGAAAGF